MTGEPRMIAPGTDTVEFGTILAIRSLRLQNLALSFILFGATTLQPGSRGSVCKQDREGANIPCIWGGCDLEYAVDIDRRPGGESPRRPPPLALAASSSYLSVTVSGDSTSESTIIGLSGWN